MNNDLIRARTAQWFIEQLGEMGIAASRLLAGTKLESDWLAREDTIITFPEYKCIITNALEVTKDSALGLKLGWSINPAMFGIFGYALMSSKTLKDAANVFLKYQDLPGQLTRISMRQDDSALVIRSAPLYPFEDALLCYAIEEVLSTTYYGIIFLANKNINPMEICLSYPAPKHAGLYKEIFKCPVRFMESENLIRFDARIFNLPVHTANPCIHEYSTQYCEKMLSGLKKSDQFINQVQNIILTSPGHFPKAEEVAKKLAMSIRSLNRRLQERNTSYKKIVDEIRSDLSIRYLSNTNLSIDQISDLVGFSEATAFRKTFKRWVGRSAAQYRKEILAGLKQSHTP
ncbi:MAG: AraC family transcriptional regulator [Smithella sp.]